MGPKDSCRNTEKNMILRGHAQGVEVDEIARQLVLTPRIVQSIIDFEEGKTQPKETKAKSKPKKKPKKKAKKDSTPEEDFS